MSKTIYCCECENYVCARKTNWLEVYPHLHPSPDQMLNVFYICDKCKNYVGSHFKLTKRYPKPLGVIPTKELRKARRHIHQVIDPIWKSKKLSRSELYTLLSNYLDIEEYHTGEISSIEEARNAYIAAKKISRLY